MKALPQNEKKIDLQNDTEVFGQIFVCLLTVSSSIGKATYCFWWAAPFSVFRAYDLTLLLVSDARVSENFSLQKFLASSCLKPSTLSYATQGAP